MSEPSTTANAWTPDWDALDRVYWNGRRGHHQSSRGSLVEVIAEYQRQAVAAGLVMVPLDDLAALVYAPVNPTVDERIYDRIEAIIDAAHAIIYPDLAATPEPAPGGDER